MLIIMMSIIFCPFYFTIILYLAHILGNNADVETIFEPSIIVSHTVSVVVSLFTVIIPLHLNTFDACSLMKQYRLYLVYN